MTTTCASSADKILQAATELFSSNNFDGTSIKEISKLSGVNSALISYYFGGKKNLYQEVLNKQSALFLDLIEQVNKQTLSPIAKLQFYTKEVSLIQLQRPMQVHLIYRELLTPSGFCNNFVQSRLYKIHQFLIASFFFFHNSSTRIATPMIYYRHTATRIAAPIVYSG